LPEIRFRDVAAEMGVVMRHGPGPRGRLLPEDTGSGLAWGDYDGDGDWDLYVVNYPGALGTTPNPEGRNRLFRNDGARFTDVTEDAGVGDPDGFGMGASFADYDGDGRMDLYVTNFGPSHLIAAATARSRRSAEGGRRRSPVVDGSRLGRLRSRRRSRSVRLQLR
jgi:hypothetical protein